MLKTYKLQNEKVNLCEAKGSNVFIFIKPNQEEIKDIINNFKIDEYYINSSLDPDELARMEFEDKYTVIIIKRPKDFSTDGNLLFKISSIGIFIFKNQLLIIMNEDIEIISFKQSKNLKTLTDLVLKIILGTISHFLGHLKAINMISESIEEKIDTSIENIYLHHMFSIEKSLVYYLNGINYNSVLFEKIKNCTKRLGFSPLHIELVDDIIVENTQCYKQAEIYTNIISGIMSTHASIVSNNLNKTIHRLTFITTIFMPLTLLASIGGMSEWTMMTKHIDWRISYSLFSVGMFLVGVITYFILKKISSMSNKHKFNFLNIFKRKINK